MTNYVKLTCQQNILHVMIGISEEEVLSFKSPLQQVTFEENSIAMYHFNAYYFHQKKFRMIILHFFL
jgi:hypothetical protein